MNKAVSFISERHLTADAIESLRGNFQKSPVGLASIEGFLKPHIAEALHTFLLEKSLYSECYGSFADGEISKEKWHGLRDDERMFHFQSMSAPRVGSEMELPTLAFLRLRHAVRNHVFDSYFAEITGVQIKRATTPHAHKYERCHFLRTHTDNKFSRKIALILYLSKNFDSRFGGCLALAKNGMVLDRVHPDFNKLAFFDVTQNEHYIEAFTSLSNGPARISIGWWFET